MAPAAGSAATAPVLGEAEVMARLAEFEALVRDRLGPALVEARARRASTIPAGRYGTREEFGAACAFLCSQHAGFIVGQNLLLDGGATNLTM